MRIPIKPVQLDDTGCLFDFFRAIELLREEYGVRPVFSRSMMSTPTKQRSPWPDGVWLLEATGAQDHTRRFMFAYIGVTEHATGTDAREKSIDSVNKLLAQHLNRYIIPSTTVKVNETTFTVERLLRLIHKTDMLLQWECL